MKFGRHLATFGFAVMLGGFSVPLALQPAFADDHDHDHGPGDHGPGPGDHHDDHGRGPGRSHAGHNDPHGRGPNVNVNINIVEPDRRVLTDYYADVARRGHCPPGLAKKGNGCFPPGQAKRWAIGRPLPREVVYYNLPPDLVGRLSPPPPGYRYVRVASDVLLIAAGTGMVAAAVEDLARF